MSYDERIRAFRMTYGEHKKLCEELDLSPLPFKLWLIMHALSLGLS